MTDGPNVTNRVASLTVLKKAKKDLMAPPNVIIAIYATTRGFALSMLNLMAGANHNVCA